MKGHSDKCEYHLLDLRDAKRIDKGSLDKVLGTAEVIFGSDAEPVGTVVISEPIRGDNRNRKAVGIIMCKEHGIAEAQSDARPMLQIGRVRIAGPEQMDPDTTEEVIQEAGRKVADVIRKLVREARALRDSRRN